MSTWEQFAIAARDHGFRGVSIRSLLETAYAAATQEQRTRVVVHATHSRIRAQVARWPEVSAEVRAVRERLLAWTGDVEEIRVIRAAAHAGFVGAYESDEADGAYAAGAAGAWDNLLFICRILDGAA